jgi:protocatechuate 3,4-dioxygenase beta subunit
MRNRKALLRAVSSDLFTDPVLHGLRWVVTFAGNRTRVLLPSYQVVSCPPSGEPVPGAVLDIWQVASNGLYENTDPSQVEFNFRGRLRAADNGTYRFWTVKPVPYPIPKDGPAGIVLDAAQRHNMRSAHIHIIVEAPGYEKVISELFVAGDPYLKSDAVFGVKDSLVVEFQLHESAEDSQKYGRPVPLYTADYDFVLVAGKTKSEVKFSAGSVNQMRSNG